MSPVYYSNRIRDFVKQNTDNIFGEIVRNDVNDSIKHQKDAWIFQIDLLKEQLYDFSDGDIIFEYTIPRVGGRIDNVILYKGIIFAVEFKAGANEYLKSAQVQARTYALDLSCFHEQKCLLARAFLRRRQSGRYPAALLRKAA
jgi:hypothetical protein